MLRTRITSSMLDFSSSIGERMSATGVDVRNRTKFTCTETRAPTERPLRPQVAMHHASSYQFQEEVEGVLELVIEPG